ncbi:MAG: cell wall hydrolase [Oscillospiraceae bacterium]|nr:cell wall hydrolase [Oscillospiraceae bacterium]
MKHAKLFALPLCLSLMLPLSTVHASAAQAPSVMLCGETYSGGCFIESGTSYIALRGALNALGGWNIEWNSASKTAVAECGYTSLSLCSANGKLTVGDADYSATVRNVGGHLYVPLRLLCNSLGYMVYWDAASRTVEVSEPSGYIDSYSDSDLYWMSRIISAESQGEPLTGQIAVGDVVLNRVASDEYPDTIYDVIFDMNDGVQFAPVSNGTVYNAPVASAVTAAKLCLEGESVVGNCMYFYDPFLSPGTWIVNNCKYYTTIGCHRFYL